MCKCKIDRSWIFRSLSPPVKIWGNSAESDKKESSLCISFWGMLGSQNISPQTQPFISVKNGRRLDRKMEVFSVDKKPEEAFRKDKDVNADPEHVTYAIAGDVYPRHHQAGRCCAQYRQNVLAIN